MKINEPQQHNYMKKIQALIASGQLKNISDVTVSHDNWCGALKGARCNCNPTVKVGKPK